MTQVVTGLFDDYAEAERAVQALESAGIPQHDISIVASNAHGEHNHLADGVTRTGDREAAGAGDGLSRGAGVGATIGGIGGLLAGLGLLAIPGVGPVVAAGWLASTIVGAGAGAVVGGVTGGLVGALTEAGVSEADAHVYAEGVRRGGALVTARAEESLVAQARDILHQTRTVDLEERRSAYQSEGWSRFDQNAPAFTRDQALAERDRYTTN